MPILPAQPQLRPATAESPRSLTHTREEERAIAALAKARIDLRAARCWLDIGHPYRQILIDAAAGLEIAMQDMGRGR